ncbi:MAG TPA: LLM class flavin-dependent oxidoreductase [Candidatus Limnocylindria bacterium]|nr:LLM class flavin-dependent oxidoreductase [Candidatus Limnocylindria bacterium]
MPTTRIGLDLKHEGRRFQLSGRDMIELAVAAEMAGVESVWTNEDIGFDSFAVLSAIAQHTQRIRLGTAIVNVYNRSAMQLAMGVATLDELSAGRAILGLSIGHHPWNDLGHGIPIEQPLSRLREYVAFLRKALSGEPFRHDGSVFHGVDTQLAFDPVRPAIPIFIAGERPRIVQLAGEVADGLLINVVSPEYIANVAADRFFSSARASGRNAEQLELTALVTCAVDDDPAAALVRARRMVVHRLRHSLKMLDTQPAQRHDEIRHLHALMQAGERDRAAEEVSEDLARSIVVAGGPQDVAAGLQRYLAAGCSRVIAVSYPRARPDVARLIAALRPVL